ncbi:MAG: sugar phosphate isomerase/epimerase [Planctomycetaceae bacterium]|nr:sugar phosphate isomerase/epimerase [Planctomycetaceae bacterium]
MHPTRRQFLSLAAGAAGLAALPATSRAAPTKSLSLGFSLYGMKTLPIDRALAECSRIGYRNVELSLIAGFPTEPAKLTPAVRANVCQQIKTSGLGVSSLLVNLNLTSDEKGHAALIDMLRTSAIFAAEIDPKNPPIIQTVLGGKPAEWEEKKALMLARLHEWNAIAREHGVIVAIKAHVSSAVNTPDRLLWLFREAAASHLAIAYDYSHFALAHLSLEETLRPLAPYTRFVHVKDARWEGDQVRFLLPGEGQTDFKKYFRLLREFGYEGPLVVEVSSQIFNRPGYDPIAAAEKSYAVLAQALKA